MCLSFCLVKHFFLFFIGIQSEYSLFHVTLKTPYRDYATKIIILITTNNNNNNNNNMVLSVFIVKHCFFCYVFLLRKANLFFVLFFLFKENQRFSYFFLFFFFKENQIFSYLFFFFLLRKAKIILFLVFCFFDKKSNDYIIVYFQLFC